MPFIELTRHSGERVLLNIANIASVCPGKRRLQSGGYADVTIVQEITSPDNYWEVVETIDEILALLKAQEEK